jgi:hypothetical protein
MGPCTCRCALTEAEQQEAVRSHEQQGAGVNGGEKAARRGAKSATISPSGIHMKGHARALFY